MDTNKAKAKIAAPIVKNEAEATRTALIDTNKAAMDAYYEVTKSEADAYKVMMDDLGYAKDSEILNYIMVKTIG
jgi:hypothetical protein